jgi:HEAT repeat protein/sugar phosphate isomerase/epimerase
MKSNPLFPFVLSLLLYATALAADTTPPPTPLDALPEGDLIQILNSDAGEKEKDDACRQLAVVGSQAAVPALARLLADERFNHLARYALETIPGPSADVALRAELTSLRGRSLVGVVGSLGVRRDKKAVKPLAELLADDDLEVVQAAARALGSIASPDSIKALQTSIPRAAIVNQTAFGEALLRGAEATLAIGETKRALSVYEQLTEMTQLPTLIRAAALRGEIIARGSKGMTLLKQSLASPEYQLFAVAIRVSLELRRPDMTRVIAESLPQLRGDRELAAFKALGALGDDCAVSALLPLTKTGDKSMRLAAIQAAAATGKPAVVPVMVELLGEADADVANAAQDALAGLTHPTAAAAVQALLANPSAQLRVAGIKLVGRRRMIAAVPDLLKAAGDPDRTVRVAALNGLGELGSPSVLQPLLQFALALSDANELELACDAARTICVRSGNPSASASAIISVCNKASPAAKAMFLSVLGAAGGPEALEAVRLALRDGHPEVHNAAVRTLTEWPDSSAAPALLQVIGTATENSERDLAFSGFIHLIRESAAANDEKFKSFIAAANLARTPGDKKLVLAGLGDISSVESLRAVSPYLSEAEVAEDASASALRIADNLSPNFAGEITSVLTRVLEVSHSEPTLEKVRNRLKQLAPDQVSKVRAPLFFPFCIDWHDARKRGYAEQAVMLKELGYDGVGHIWLDGVADRLKTLDEAKLRLFQITMSVDLTPGKAPYDAKFKDVLTLVKGRGVQFCLLMNGAPASDPSADARGVKVLREMSDLAKESGAQLLLYPHVGCWVERIEDSIRVAEKVDRPNVGVMFNLCHWLRVDKERDYRPLLQKAMPRLWAVSLNGADVRDEKPGWGHYIQPLDKGSFDVAGLLKTLKELGYKGPFGLQCFGIGGDAREHLARSIVAWRKLNEQLPSH